MMRTSSFYSTVERQTMLEGWWGVVAGGWGRTTFPKLVPQTNRIVTLDGKCNQTPPYIRSSLPSAVL